MSSRKLVVLCHYLRILRASTHHVLCSQPLVILNLLISLAVDTIHLLNLTLATLFLLLELPLKFRDIAPEMLDLALLITM